MTAYRETLRCALETLVEGRGLEPDAELVEACLERLEAAPETASQCVRQLLSTHAFEAGQGGIRGRKEITRIADYERVFMERVLQRWYAHSNSEGG